MIVSDINPETIMERKLLVSLLELVAGMDEARWRPARGDYSNLDILAVLLWAAVNDRPISWAVERCNWPLCLHRRPLPSNATVSRRSRACAITRLLDALIARQRVAGVGSRTLIVDGRALVIAMHSGDRDAGIGRGRGGMARGYKLHEITDLLGHCRVFRVEPLNVSEQAATRDMIGELRHGEAEVMLADANDDCNALYQLAGERGIQLLAARRYRNAKGLGHHRHSPHRLKGLDALRSEPERLRPRRLIEGVFGTQGNIIGGLGPLPNHVRGLRRVRLWVAAKLAIDAAHRRRRLLQRTA